MEQGVFIKLKVLFRKLTFGVRNRIFFSITLFFSLLIFLFSGVLIAYNNNAAERQAKEALANLADQMTSSLDNYIDTVKDSLIGLVHDNTIPRIINREYQDDVSRYQLYFTFYDNASSLLHFESFDTNQIYLVDPELRFQLSSNAYFTMNASSRLSWLESVEASQSYFHYLLEFNAPKIFQDQFGFAVAIDVNDFANQYLDHNAYLVMVVGRSRFQYAIKQMDDMPFTALVIQDQEGRTVYSHHNQGEGDVFAQVLEGYELGDYPGGVDVGNTFYRIYTAPSKNTGWRLIFFHDQTSLREANRRVVRSTMLFDCMAVLLLLVAAYLLARTITLPVKKLMDGMDEMGRGNHRVKVSIHSNDEMGLLGKNFNHMAQQIDTLVNQVYREEMLRRDAEIRTLQQQINPHFLYNTLEIINALTNRGDKQGVKLVTNRIAGLFRYSLDREKCSLPTVMDELQYTEDYISIQQVRYRDRLQYAVRVEEGLSDFKMLRFLLQPVVENCFSHGFREAGTTMSITVSCEYKDEALLFLVVDNGAGMNRDRLLDVQEMLYLAGCGKATPKEKRDPWNPRGVSVGLCNVHARIRLKYGAPYGVEIDSEIGKGTTVRMLIPISESEES